jgi:saccharopine dehydrogenase-like NADP-dependent oxidoreductase
MNCQANNLIFMNEIGLDPGIDHMSAMKVIDQGERWRNDSFESFCD